MSDIAIHVEELGKVYRIGAPERAATNWWQAAKNVVISPFDYLIGTLRGPTAAEILWALRDVSFEVKHGEVLGVIGRNGAGKSTLLKVLSRITDPTEGQAQLYGRVASLLEVGTGFHSELTGRENVYMNGAILGMTRAEIDRKFEEIVAFAGVQKFIDTQVKRYSSGMRVRLGFAVAAHLEPEILLIDEVLAVGDIAFQKKCLGKMKDVATTGRTVLFVSHNMGTIGALCPRSIHLDQGRLVYDGPSTDTIAHYLASMQEQANINLRERKDRQGIGGLRFVGTWVENSRGERVDTLLSGEEAKIVAEYEAEPKVTGSLSVAFALSSQYDQLTDIESEIAGFEWSHIPDRGRVYCRLPRLPLNVGQYNYNICGRINDVIADWVLEAGQFNVSSGDFFNSGRPPRPDQGYFLLESDWKLEPVE